MVEYCSECGEALTKAEIKYNEDVLNNHDFKVCRKCREEVTKPLFEEES